MRFGDTYQHLPPPVYKRTGSGQASREILQMVVPFDVFDAMVESGRVDFDLCGRLVTLADSLMATAKRFRFRLSKRLRVASQTPHGQATPEVSDAPGRVEPAEARPLDPLPSETTPSEMAPSETTPSETEHLGNGRPLGAVPSSDDEPGPVKSGDR